MNNPTLERIRDSMADVGGHHRYFTAIADRQQKRHLWFSFASIMSSLGAATILLATSGGISWRILGAILFLAVSATMVAMIVWDFSRKAQIALTAATRLDEIDVELRRLWHSTHRNRETDVITDLERLERRINAVIQVEISTDRSLRDQCYTEAWEVIDSYYPAGTGEANENRAPETTAA